MARRRRRRQSKAKRAGLPLCVHDWPAEASVGCLNLSFGRHAVQAKDADMVSYEHVSAAVAVVVAVDQEPHAVRSLPCGGGTGRTQGFTFVGKAAIDAAQSLLCRCLGLRKKNKKGEEERKTTERRGS